MSETNPLLSPIQDSFFHKRNRKTGLVPRNWLLVILCLLDHVRESDRPLQEDDVYTYDFTLKKSRSAIPSLLKKYNFPTKLGMSHEGVTVRGAPGLRFFRAIGGGQVIADRSKAAREALVLEAVELVRAELLKVLRQNPISLPASAFDQTGTFVAALLSQVEYRSRGRVEQTLVGAKLQLRFPDVAVSMNPTFAGDEQTGRECDYAVNNLRVIVSVAPKENHFQSARSHADERRNVFLVVSEKTLPAAKKKIRESGYAGTVIVTSVDDYVASNMSEVASERGLTPRQMCMELVAEYNRRISSDYDLSLQVVMPS